MDQETALFKMPVGSIQEPPVPGWNCKLIADLDKTGQEKARKDMGKVKDLIEEMIQEFEARNEGGHYIHTIRVLEKMKDEFSEPEEPSDITNNERGNDF